MLRQRGYRGAAVQSALFGVDPPALVGVGESAFGS
jgi:hypothetical protein